MNARILLCVFLAAIATSVWADRGMEATIRGEVTILDENKEGHSFIAIDERKSDLIPKEEGRTIYLTAPKEKLEELLYLGNRKINAKGTLFRDTAGKWQMNLTSYRLLAQVVGRISPEVQVNSPNKVKFIVNTQRSAMFKKGPTSLFVSQAELINMQKFPPHQECLLLGFMSINPQGQQEFEVVEALPYEQCIGEVVVKTVELQRSNQVFHLLPSEKQQKIASLNEQIVRVYGVKVKKGNDWFFHVMDYTTIDPSDREN